jgi:hypothetical protein
LHISPGVIAGGTLERFPAIWNSGRTASGLMRVGRGFSRQPGVRASRRPDFSEPSDWQQAIADWEVDLPPCRQDGIGQRLRIIERPRIAQSVSPTNGNLIII